MKNQLTDGFVLFLDILGFKNKVKNIKLDKELHNIIKLLTDMEKSARSLTKADGWIVDLKVVTFSDSVIITIPYNSCKNGAYVGCKVAMSAGAHYQSGLIKRGYLTRGYLVWGKYFHKKNILVGAGLIEAYENERDMGNMPFIGVHEKIIEETKRQQATTPNSNIYLSVFDWTIQYKEKYVVDYLNKKIGTEYVHSSEELRGLIEKAKEEKAFFNKPEEKEIESKWSCFLSYAEWSLNNRSPNQSQNT